MVVMIISMMMKTIREEGGEGTQIERAAHLRVAVKHHIRVRSR